LLKLGNAEGKMKAVQSASSVPDTQLTELLRSSQGTFLKTFEEYLKLWRIIPERANVEEVLQLWASYLNQCQKYVEEPVPFIHEQLIEDETLCKVHHSIICGQNQSLSSLVEQRPLDFESVEALYRDVEHKLTSRQKQIQSRLEIWKSYRKSSDTFSVWMRRMEKEKRSLDLPFLQLKRLPTVKTQIEVCLFAKPNFLLALRYVSK
jgi:hypothetical protein